MLESVCGTVVAVVCQQCRQVGISVLMLIHVVDTDTSMYEFSR